MSVHGAITTTPDPRDSRIAELESKIVALDRLRDTVMVTLGIACEDRDNFKHANRELEASARELLTAIYLNVPARVALTSSAPGPLRRLEKALGMNCH